MVSETYISMKLTTLLASYILTCAAPVLKCPLGVVVLQDEDSEFTLATDFEIGHFFRERIVPRAVLYFTGEALEDDESVSDPFL